MHMIVSTELTFVRSLTTVRQVARSVSCIRDKAAGTYRQAQGGTGEPVLVECAQIGKIVCG